MFSALDAARASNIYPEHTILERGPRLQKRRWQAISNRGVCSIALVVMSLAAVLYGSKCHSDTAAATCLLSCSCIHIPPSLLLFSLPLRRRLLLLWLPISETQCHPFFGVALSFKRLSTGRARTASCTCRLLTFILELQKMGVMSSLGLGSGMSGFRNKPTAFGLGSLDRLRK